MRSTVFARFLFTMSVLMLALNMANGAVITFGPIPGPSDAPYAGHMEAGFTVTPTAGNWFQALLYGNPIPSVYAGPIGTPGISSLQVVDTSLPFVFAGLDHSSQNDQSDIQIQGFLGAALVFNQMDVLGASLPPAFGFSHLASANPSAVIDLLRITITPGPFATSINIDNIDVTKIPEPNTLFLLAPFVSALLLLRHATLR